MQKLSLIGAGVALCVMSAAAQAQDRTYDLTGFDEISVHDGVRAEVTVGDRFEVTANALRGDIDRLDVELRGDRLVISRNQAWGFWAAGKGDRFAVQITLPTLAEVESTAGASVKVSGNADALTSAQSSSGSELIIADAAADKIVLLASSGSNLKISGQCRQVEAQSSSGSSMDASDFACAVADLQSSSGSSLSANASETAEVQSSSGASLRLRGGAQITDESVSSGASFRQD